MQKKIKQHDRWILKSYMDDKITLHPVHCLISMYQITNLYDRYSRNDWIFQCLGIDVIFQNLCFQKTPLA